LDKGLSKDHLYHNLSHTLSVRKTSVSIGERYRLTPEEFETLELAALFHDTGFTKTYNGHEDVSMELAASFLAGEQYPESKIGIVKNLIEATKVGTEPQTLLQKILKDADFNTYDASYMEKSDALRYEWRVFCGIEMTDEEWLANSYKFWQGHQFYTGEGQAMFGEDKRKLLKKLTKQLGLDEKKEKKSKDDPDELNFAINESKSAQMMFKTTLRNHVDLTNIADNKANIMLSINSLLITLSISMLGGNIEKFPNLIYPAIALLTTCTLSIVYATLATRPVKMQGYTDLSKIGVHTTNLFFFGNFFKMGISEYKEGLKKVVKDEKVLDDTIVTDLFWLGKALGAKFQRLRTCYMIFMIGMIITVATFAVSFLFR
jgi:hypothetical protein